MFGSGTEAMEFDLRECANCPFYNHDPNAVTPDEQCNIVIGISCAYVGATDAWPSEWLEKEDGRYICRKKRGLEPKLEATK